MGASMDADGGASGEMAEGIDLAGIDYGRGASILLFADDPHERSRMAGAIKAAGGRLSVAMTLGEAVGRIEDHAAPDGVVVTVGRDQAELAEDIFDTLEQGARAQRFRSVAIIDAALIDLAAARTAHRDIELLCEADSGEVATAFSHLVSPRRALLNDISADGSPVRLRDLSEQVGRIARTLAALSENEAGERAFFPKDGRDAGDEAEHIDAATLRAIIRARRMRDQYLGEIFADPAWDMLLDLMAARLEGQPVAVSSLCIAAAVPPTTGLRWIKALTDSGMLIRVNDPNDRRRVFIELSPRAVEAITAYFAAARRIAMSPI